jgi:thymidylate synthase
MEINIIVAFCKKFGIGTHGTIPWNIEPDLKRFGEITLNQVVVVGRKTYESIGRPLEDRLNIVLTRKPEKYDNTDNLIYCDMQGYRSLYHSLSQNKEYNRLFVIGGSEIYKIFLPQTKNLYITQIDKLYDCDQFFPQFTNFRLESYSEKYHDDNNSWRYLNYISTFHNSVFLSKNNPRYISRRGECIYLSLVRDILKNGGFREDRTGTGTLAVFGRQINFDIKDSIPLLTTKFVSWRIIIEELLWFLRGNTDSKILEEHGVNIWKSNTTKTFLKKRGLDYNEGDVGPMYGYNWRNYGYPYSGCHQNYSGKGIDQFTEVIQLLKTDPYSRRIMMTTYDVSCKDKGVLIPCHGINFQLYVKDKGGKKYLSGHMTQRSADTFLGLPINIPSYTTLIYILAKLCDMYPDELIISLGDTHIYKDHIDLIKKQLTLKPYPFPKLVVSDDIKYKKIEEITPQDFDLIGYLYHPMIKGKMSV